MCVMCVCVNVYLKAERVCVRKKAYLNISLDDDIKHRSYHNFESKSVVSNGKYDITQKQQQQHNKTFIAIFTWK